MKRKSMVLLIVLLAVSLVATACSNSSTTDEGAASKTSGKKEKQTLVVWTYFGQVKLLAKQFEKSHPNVDVKVKVFPGDQYKTKLQTALQTKTNVPDVFDLERAYISYFINTPYVANLSEMGADELVDKMVPYVAALGKDKEGNVRAVADSSSPTGFWYHRKAAKKWIGTDDPDKISKMVDSWDGVIELAKQVKQKSGGKVHLLDSSDSVFALEKYQMHPWVNDEKEFSIDPGWNKVLNVMRTIRSNNLGAKLAGFSPGWGSALNNYDPNAPAIMYGLPSWATFMIDTDNGKAEGQFGVAKAPVGSYEGGTYRAIYSKTPNKQLAYEFVKFDASKEWQTYNLKHTGNMPSDVAVYKENMESYSPPMFGDQKVLKMYYDISMSIPAEPAGLYREDINSMFGKIVTDMLNKKKSNDWAFDQLKAKVKESYPEIKIK
ncbi:MAG TPA: extracellular solute-binding protein [Bacillales bacterium]|nr:extracellular solute-binding protein [Bacillales bacterium]